MKKNLIAALSASGIVAILILAVESAVVALPYVLVSVFILGTLDHVIDVGRWVNGFMVPNKTGNAILIVLTWILFFIGARLLLSQLDERDE